MKLRSLQRQVAWAVMTPLTRSDRMRKEAPDGRSLAAVASRIIKPNNRLTAFERLELYNRQYWFRILDALSDDFPGLRGVIGDTRFNKIAQAYLADCPSRSFTMRNLGDRLDAWLSRHPRYAGKRQKLALDMIRLEWAEIEAFDGLALPPVTLDSLTNSAAGSHLDPSELRLRLQPYVRLLSLRYPVDNLLLALKQAPPADVASNAIHKRRTRQRVSAVAGLAPATVYLAVHRMDNSIYFRRLQKEEFAILRSLQKGQALGRAIASGFRGSGIPLNQRAAQSAEWFKHWASLGWFAPREQ
jgi:Putative DNA-binding domain